MKDTDPILFGVATGCAVVGVYIIGTVIWDKFQDWYQQRKGRTLS